MAPRKAAPNTSMKRDPPTNSSYRVRDSKVSKSKTTTGTARAAAVATAAKSTSAQKAGKPVATAPKKKINSAPSKRLEVFVFGENSAGELGLGDGPKVKDVKAPRLNPNLDASSVGVVEVSTGGMHAIALTHDNKLLSWGMNDTYNLGRDTTWDGGLRDMDADSDDESDSGLNPREAAPEPVPTDKFPAGTKFVQVSAGDSASFVLTDTGLVYGWGTFIDSNGNKTFSVDVKATTRDKAAVNTQTTPILIPGLKNIVAISAGNNFCLALDSAGRVYSWGQNEQQELGRHVHATRRNTTVSGIVDSFSAKPVEFPRGKKFASIHAASNHAFAIEKDTGVAYGWGLNNFAQTGVVQGAGEGGSVISPPQRVTALKEPMKDVQGGNHHSLGLTQSGKCLVWGRIDGGQGGFDLSSLPLDDPSKVAVDMRGKPRILLEPRSPPIAGSAVTDIAAGPDHNLCVTAEGKAYSWGFNINYQCGQKTDDDIPIAKVMDGKQIIEKKVTWAGAGGQYSMLAAEWQG